MLPEPEQSAVMAVGGAIEERLAAEWFTFLLDTHAEVAADGDESWDEVLRRVRDRGAGIVGDSGVDAFRQVLEELGYPLDTVRALAGYSVDELAAAFGEGLRERAYDAEDRDEDGAEDAPAPALEEPGNWTGFVARQSGFWSTWDGGDWPEWRTAFLTLARANGVGEDAEEQLDWMEDHEPTPVDKVRYLKEVLRFAISDSALARVAAGIPGPDGDWGTFVAAQKGFWAGWDGQNWPEWRTAFLDLGEAQGVPDDAREQLEWLETAEPTLAAKLLYLRDTLGFDIDEALLDRELAAQGENEDDQRPATPVLSEQRLAELARLRPRAEQAFTDAIAGVLAPEVAELFAGADLAELFARFPEAADLSADEIAALVRRATTR